MQKKVLISIPESLNERWGEVAKKHDITKSGMIEEFLYQVLPILEESVPSKMLSKAMKEMGKQIDTSATLFDILHGNEKAMAEHDQSVEDYKELKRG